MTGKSKRCAFNTFALLSILLLTACKEELYSGLQESEANEMVALLARSDVSVTREREKKGTYSISVDGSSVALAIEILNANDYPRKKYETLGELFAPQGIVSTPFEQRARFIYALNQELSQTISSVPGVRKARVHIMIPEMDRFDKQAPQAQASVVIYHEPSAEMASSIPAIKQIVAHSVQYLAYEDVSLALFKAEDRAPQGRSQSNELVSVSTGQMANVKNKTPVVRSEQFQMLTLMFAVLFGTTLMIKNVISTAIARVFRRRAKQ